MQRFRAVADEGGLVGELEMGMNVCMKLEETWGVCHSGWVRGLFLLGKLHGLRSLVGYSPWGRKELDMTERLHFTEGSSCPKYQGGLIRFFVMEQGFKT